MTGLVRREVTNLAGVLAELKERVRVALAGEIARAVAGAVREVVHAVAAGRADAPRPEPVPACHRPSSGRWDDGDDDRGRAHDPWDDCDPDAGYDSDRPTRTAPPARVDLTAPPVTTAVAAGVHVARWWLSRRGGVTGAVGAGLAVGLLGLAGGPAVRAALAALAAAADLLAVTDALGDAAARLGHP